MTSQCIEVAKAVNSLVAFAPEDQEALLEVIGDYFTCPSPQIHNREEIDSGMQSMIISLPLFLSFFF